jgi:hypothetical protein
MTDFLYGCNNGKRPVANAPILVQDGYFGGYDPVHAAIARTPKWVTIPFVMSTECHFDASANDPGCKGCAHAPHLRSPAK